MKKLLTLALVLMLVFSLAFTMSSCDFLNNLFGGDDPVEDPDDNDQGDKPGDQPDGDTPSGDIVDGVIGGGDGIELPIVDVNSQDMTIPPEGTEDTETPDAE